jgi:hypothetical protein
VQRAHVDQFGLHPGAFFRLLQDEMCRMSTPSSLPRCPEDDRNKKWPLRRWHDERAKD